MDDARDMCLEEEGEDVKLDSFSPGNAVEIEGANILNLRRRHAERRTFEQDPGSKE